MIRHASLEDWDGLLALARATQQHIEPARLTRTFEHILANGVVLIAEDDGVITSACGVVMLQALATDAIYAEALCWFTDPTKRTILSGRRVLDAVEAWALQNGAESVKLVAVQGSRAGRYLGRRGYEAVETAYVRVLNAESDPGVHAHDTPEGGE